MENRSAPQHSSEAFLLFIEFVASLNERLPLTAELSMGEGLPSARIWYYFIYGLPKCVVREIMRLLKNGPLRHGCNTCHRICKVQTLRLMGADGKLLVDNQAFYDPADFLRLRELLDGPTGCYKTHGVIGVAIFDPTTGMIPLSRQFGGPADFGTHTDDQYPHFRVTRPSARSPVSNDTCYGISRAFPEYSGILAHMFGEVDTVGPTVVLRRLEQYDGEWSASRLTIAVNDLVQRGGLVRPFASLSGTERAIFYMDFLTSLGRPSITEAGGEPPAVKYGTIHALCSGGILGKVIFKGLSGEFAEKAMGPEERKQVTRKASADQIAKLMRLLGRDPNPMFATTEDDVRGIVCNRLMTNTGHRCQANLDGSVTGFLVFLHTNAGHIKAVLLGDRCMAWPFSTGFTGPFPLIQKTLMLLGILNPSDPSRCKNVREVIGSPPCVVNIVHVLKTPTNHQERYIFDLGPSAEVCLSQFGWDKANLLNAGNLLPQYSPAHDAAFVGYGATHPLVVTPGVRVIAGIQATVQNNGKFDAPVELRIVHEDGTTRDVHLDRS